MECEFEMIDLSKATDEQKSHWNHLSQLAFRLNHTMPSTDEYAKIQKELFGDNLGEGSRIATPIYGACLDKIKIGKKCVIQVNLLAMVAGGITIGDDVKIAANVQLITNNHDPYKREILPCKPIVIDDGAWIGAGATILLGVRIGRHAIVGAASVVTRDVGDYEVAVGNPAKVIKTLNSKKFKK